MSLYIHQTNSDLDFIITTDDDPMNDDILHPITEELEPATEKDETLINKSKEENPKKQKNDTDRKKKESLKPTKKATMIKKKKKEEPQECTICARIFTTLRSLLYY